MDPSSGIDSPGGLDLEGMLHSLLSFPTNICQQVHECSAECNVETPNQNFPQIKLLDISGPHCHSHRRLCPARHCSHPCSRRPRPRSSPFVSLHVAVHVLAPCRSCHCPCPHSSPFAPLFIIARVSPCLFCLLSSSFLPSVRPPLCLHSLDPSLDLHLPNSLIYPSRYHVVSCR